MWIIDKNFSLRHLLKTNIDYYFYSKTDSMSNGVSMNSPAMEDVLNSTNIYLYKSRETNQFYTSYEEPNLLSNEYELIEVMVVRNDIDYIELEHIDSRLNTCFNPNRRDDHCVISEWIHSIQQQIQSDYPFWYFHDGIRTYFQSFDRNQLPNIDVIKYWKQSIGNSEYECFASEYILNYHEIDELVVSSFNGCQFSTISHILARLYDEDRWIIELINNHIPRHRNELDRKDIFGKIPRDYLIYPTDEIKNMF